MYDVIIWEHDIVTAWSVLCTSDEFFRRRKIKPGKWPRKSGKLFIGWEKNFERRVILKSPRVETCFSSFVLARVHKTFGIFDFNTPIMMSRPNRLLYHTLLDDGLLLIFSLSLSFIVLWPEPEVPVAFFITPPYPFQPSCASSLQCLLTKLKYSEPPLQNFTKLHVLVSFDPMPHYRCNAFQDFLP